MRIRQAVSADYSAIATVSVKAHTGDKEIEFVFPRQNAYPDAFHRWYVLRVKHFAMFPQTFVIVAETEPSDPCWDGKTRLTGYCLWSREGDSKETRTRWRTKKSVLKSLYFHTHRELQLQLANHLTNSSKRNHPWLPHVIVHALHDDFSQPSRFFDARTAGGT